MATTTKLSIAQVKKLMNETYNWEDFAKFLFDYGTLVFDSINEIQNERERFFLYKGQYFYFTRVNGEITATGWDSNKPVAVEVWNNRGITYLYKTTKLPLGTINANVKYIIREK